ncbi:MAG TPA: hypothetical protein VFT59_00395 [Candidatus Saccharimonadales bacterium]|nr:hypothetical protein [Candidatus Saccharimonadales bacterium]
MRWVLLFAVAAVVNLLVMVVLDDLGFTVEAGYFWPRAGIALVIVCGIFFLGRERSGGDQE